MSNNYRTEIKVILTRIMVESLCVYPFFIFLKKKSSWERSFSPAERVANFQKQVSAVRRTCSTINVNYKTTFFFFILGVGTHWAPRGISGDSVPLRKRVVRLLLQAVTSECLRKREKKRESEREQGRGREGGKKAVNEGRRGRLLPFEKAEKLLGALTGRLWVWRRHGGVVPHTSFPYVINSKL